MLKSFFFCVNSLHVLRNLIKKKKKCTLWFNAHTILTLSAVLSSLVAASGLGTPDILVSADAILTDYTGIELMLTNCRILLEVWNVP